MQATKTEALSGVDAPALLGEMSPMVFRAICEECAKRMKAENERRCSEVTTIDQSVSLLKAERAVLTGTINQVAEYIIVLTGAKLPVDDLEDAVQEATSER